jgi:predicted TIM-barrel fold metal-dependent hydrolase
MTAQPARSTVLTAGGGHLSEDMEAKEVEGIELMLKNSRQLPYPVFDADNHFYETPEALTKFLPSQYEGLIKYVDVDGRATLCIDGKLNRLIPNPTFERVAPPGGQANDPRQRRSLAAPNAFFEPDARIKLMRELGIDRALMFPTLSGVVEQQLRHDLAAFHAVAHGLNQWMHETWSFNYEDTIFGVPIVPLSILDEGIKELEWVLERGAHAIWVRVGPVPGFPSPRSFALPDFDPFWKLVEEADIVVGMHGGDVGYNEYLNVWEGLSGKELTPFRSVGSPAFRRMANENVPMVDAIASIIGHGLATRFPKLKFAPIEIRPFAVQFLERVQRIYEEAPAIFEEDPIEVFKRNIFVHSFQDREPQKLVDVIGIDNVMFGSDFPHQEGMNDPLAYVDFLKDMSLEDQAKIMGGNLARIMKVGA